VRKERAELAEIVERFRAGGGKDRPLALQIQISWAQNLEEARIAAWEQWRNAAAPPSCLAELRTPDDFDAVTQTVKPEDIGDVIPLITQPDELLEIIHECRSCGFGEIYIHNVSRNQLDFFRFMKREVLPQVQINAQ
jgi:hypothetical protein